MVRVNEKTVLDWIHRFETDGLDGLQERAGHGVTLRQMSMNVSSKRFWMHNKTVQVDTSQGKRYNDYSRSSSKSS